MKIKGKVIILWSLCGLVTGCIVLFSPALWRRANTVTDTHTNHWNEDDFHNANHFVYIMQLWLLRYKLTIVIYKVQIWGKKVNYFQVQLWVYINYSSNFIARNFYIISCIVDKLLIAHKCKFISHNSEKSSQNCETLKKKNTIIFFNF